MGPVVKEHPLVSVLLPVRNGGAFLTAAVRSIQLQTYPHWELLVLDDGSSDGALEAIERMQDTRIRIVPGAQSLGIAARLNQGVALARGEFIARMDADDVSFPERFACQLALMAADETLDLVGVAAVTMDSRSRLLGLFPRRQTHAQICSRPWLGFHLLHPGWMGRAAWFRAHPYAAEPAPYACEDQDLLLRTYRTSRFACTTRVLLAYRVRSRVDWRKLRQTRTALWHCQVHHFSREGAWHYLGLSCACLLLRLLRDASLRWSGRPLFTADPHGVGEEVRRGWQALQARLS